MKRHLIKKYVVSVFLLLVFFQQTGAGLYIHNLFHETERPVQMAHDREVSSEELIIACSCVDNFLMPFIDADIAFSLQPFHPHIKPVDSFSAGTYFTSLIFSSLRGPPVV